jgi:hypothetical protein
MGYELDVALVRAGEPRVAAHLPHRDEPPRREQARRAHE